MNAYLMALLQHNSGIFIWFVTKSFRIIYPESNFPGLTDKNKNYYLKQQTI